MLKEKEYKCIDCAFFQTPYCEGCNQITSPSGKKSRPTRFTPGIPQLTISGGRSSQFQRMQLYIRYCIENNTPIPIKVVEEYNKKASTYFEQ